jgi:hypothetical protein
MADGPQDTRDVAAAYWGQGAPKQTDIHGLGAPPRTLTIGMEEFVRARIKTGPWVALTIFAALILLPMALVMGKSWLEPVALLVVTAATIVLIRRSAEIRRRDLRWFLENANLHGATIEKVHARILRRRGLAGAAMGDAGTYTLSLIVDGVPGRVRCITHDTGLGNLIQPGQRLEVLLHPKKPTYVITTAELPSA